MNKFFIALGFLAISTLGISQTKEDSKITWTVAAKKINSTTAEVYFKAKLAPTWHIWSLNPGDEMLIAPSFTFNKGITVIGNAREIGKKISKTEEGFKNKLHYYEGTVVFVQKVKIGKDNMISGSINYQICDPKRCLPPTDFEFSTKLK